MPQFSYKAIGRDGKALSGVIEAGGQELAARQLRGQGMTLLKLEPGVVADAAGPAGAKAVKREQVLAMTSELAVLLRAGLPLDRALKVLIDMSVNPAMTAVLGDLLKDVKGGRALSQALQAHESIFGTLYISLVRSGEASGHLSAVLDRLVEYLQRAKANRDSVVSALIYPVILLVVATLSVAVMLGFVVPQFESLFADMGDALPLLTRGVIAGADLVKSWGWLLALVVVGLVFYLRRWLASPGGRESFDRRMLRVPVIGGIIFEYEMSKFATTVGTLLDNGVSLLKAISIAIDTVDNRVLNEGLRILPPAVKAGRRMSAALEESALFTPMVIQMTRVGEESGSLDKMMLELGRVFDEHVQSGIKRGLTFLEPLLILGMGAVIALIIISILMGILSVNDLAM